MPINIEPNIPVERSFAHKARDALVHLPQKLRALASKIHDLSCAIRSKWQENSGAPPPSFKASSTSSSEETEESSDEEEVASASDRKIVELFNALKPASDEEEVNLDDFLQQEKRVKIAEDKNREYEPLPQDPVIEESGLVKASIWDAAEAKKPAAPIPKELQLVSDKLKDLVRLLDTTYENAHGKERVKEGVRRRISEDNVEKILQDEDSDDEDKINDLRAFFNTVKNEIETKGLSKKTGIAQSIQEIEQLISSLPA